MIMIRGLASTALFLALLSPTIASDSQRSERDGDVDPSFQKLLNQVDPPSLHSALHNFSPKKFQHGMFKEDRTAVEALHKEEPSIATSIIYLAKRQESSNGTSPATTTVLAQPSSSPESPESTEVSEPGSSSVVVAPGPSSAPAESSASPSPSPNPESSSPSVPTTSAEPSSSPEPLSSVPVSSAAASTSFPAETSSAAVTSAAPSLTTGEVISSTNANGLVVVSTIGGGVRTITPSGAESSAKGGGSKTSVLVHVSTLPNGEQSTITAVTVVGAGSSDEGSTPTGVAGVSPSGTGSHPGLQTGEAVMTRGFGWEGVGVLIGAVGFAVMM